MKVINDLMGYEGLKIVQDPEMFNFSLDSMLLAHFATINKKVDRIIDLCSGNAPVPLYLTLRTKKKIVGVEIQKKAYDLGCESVKINSKEEQISILNTDLKLLPNIFDNQAFDLVLCNPPFFKYHENSNVNKNDFLTIARHEVMATLDDIVKTASYLLNNGGYLAMVHRPDRLLDVLETFRKYKIEPKRLQFVYPRLNEDANHILIEGIKAGNNGGLHILKPLIIYDGPNWTEDVKKIYNYKEGNEPCY